MSLEHPSPPRLARRTISALLAQAGRPTAFRISLLKGGANNRVFHLQQRDGALILKQYFRHPEDPRDRFMTERAFYEFLHDRGLRSMPAPLAWDAENRLAILEFLDGRKLRQSEVGARRVREAIDFFLDINRHRNHPAAARIPIASEACFSIAHHLECIGDRVRRLSRIDPSSPVDHAAVRFVAQRLIPAWNRVRESVLRRSKTLGLDPEIPIPPQDRCLSPSDFGFHNAILCDDRSLRFFDFEYAGWDDPAKLACDFFCQPAIPTPARLWPSFLNRLFPAGPAHAEAKKRARALLPAYRVKWCCIMLNEFVRTGQARRQFAKVSDSAEARKRRQLAMARACLSRMRA